MPSSRIRLITRGDDCGSNHTANAAILEAYQKGILRNISIMACCSAIEEAAEMLVGEKGLCCGLHATLNAEWDKVRWGPVLPPAQVPSLVDAHGHFFQTTRALHENAPVIQEVMEELQAQLDRLRKLGFDIRYADMHMGFGWVLDGLDEEFDRWCEQEHVLNSSNFSQRLPRVDAEGDPVEQLIAQLAAAEPGQYLIVGHPAYDNEEMRQLGHDGYPGDFIGPERDWQRRIFMDERILHACREHAVSAIRYDEAERLR